MEDKLSQGEHTLVVDDDDEHDPVFYHCTGVSGIKMHSASGQVQCWDTKRDKRTCTEVMDPLCVVVMRSCRPPRSVARVGWYPTAEGIRPSRADTSELACKRSLSLQHNTTNVQHQCIA